MVIKDRWEFEKIQMNSSTHVECLFAYQTPPPPPQIPSLGAKTLEKTFPRGMSLAGTDPVMWLCHLTTFNSLQQAFTASAVLLL